MTTWPPKLPPTPEHPHGGNSVEDDRYNAAYEDARQRLGMPPSVAHLYACKKLVDDSGLDLHKHAAERRGAQLRALVHTVLDSQYGAPQSVRMHEVMPTDLISDKDLSFRSTERWLYVEASAPAFRGESADGTRGWTLHTIGLEDNGHLGGMRGGSGEEFCRVRRLPSMAFHGQRWSCPTCLCNNMGDACRGCGTTRTERAFYAKRADEGLDVSPEPPGPPEPPPAQTSTVPERPGLYWCRTRHPISGKSEGPWVATCVDVSTDCSGRPTDGLVVVGSFRTSGQSVVGLPLSDPSFEWGPEIVHPDES